MSNYITHTIYSSDFKRARHIRMHVKQMIHLSFHSIFSLALYRALLYRSILILRLKRSEHCGVGILDWQGL